MVKHRWRYWPCWA